MTSPAPSSSDAAPHPQNPPPPLPISSDLLCMQCHYNLRTRTAADRCPECGIPISQTLAHLQQAAGVLIDERAYRVCAFLLAGISIAAVPVYASQALFESPLSTSLPRTLLDFINPVAMSLLHAFFLVALVVAMLLFFASLSQRVLSPGVRSLASVITILYAAASAPLGLAYTARMVRVRLLRFAAFRGGGAIVEHRVSVALISILLLSVGFICLRRLAKALASDPLQRSVRWVFPIMFAQAILPLGIFLLLGTHGIRRGWALPDPRVLIAPDILSAVASAIFAWFWLSPARSIGRRISIQVPNSPPAANTAATPSSNEKISEFLKRRT